VTHGWAAPSLTSSVSINDQCGLKTIRVLEAGSNCSFLKVFILHKYGSLIKLLVLQGRASASDLHDQTGGLYCSRACGQSFGLPSQSSFSLQLHRCAGKLKGVQEVLIEIRSQSVPCQCRSVILVTEIDILVKVLLAPLPIPHTLGARASPLVLCLGESDEIDLQMLFHPRGPRHR
jgi:hypothetical protein